MYISTTIIIICLLSLVLGENYVDIKMGKEPMVNYFCVKLKSCDPVVENGKVCGWSYKDSEMAIFDNICVMYRTNCVKKTQYWQADMVVCENKKKVEKANKDIDLEWIHIRDDPDYPLRTRDENSKEASSSVERSVSIRTTTINRIPVVTKLPYEGPTLRFSRLLHTITTTIPLEPTESTTIFTTPFTTHRAHKTRSRFAKKQKRS